MIGRKRIKTKILLHNEEYIRGIATIKDDGAIYKLISGYGNVPQNTKFNVRDLGTIYDAHKSFPSPYFIELSERQIAPPPWMIKEIYTPKTHPEHFI